MAYQVDLVCSDDESFTFALPFEWSDGSAFPFDDYAIEYVITLDGSQVYSWSTATEGVAASEGVVVFGGADYSLREGVHRHGCRVRHNETDEVTQVFVGDVTVENGEFSS